MENFKSALLDFVKFQNAQQLQLQETVGISTKNLDY